jgi:hypothetical protein
LQQGFSLMDDLDRKLRDAYTRDPVDTRALERAIRTEIRRESRGRTALRFASAAALAVAILGGYWVARRSPEPKIYRDAALDHRAEVVQKLPRRWRTTDPELDTLTARFGLSRQRVALSGYRLLRAKICLLDGQRVLHLVYNDGSGEYSLFLPAGNKPVPEGETWDGAEHIEGFHAGRKTGLVVSDGTAADCRRFAKTVALANL